MESFCIIKWYNHMDKMYHRQGRAGSSLAPVYAPNGNLPPFQLIVTGTPASATLSLEKYIPGTSTMGGQTVYSASLTVEEMEGVPGYSLLRFKGVKASIPNGLYYYQLGTAYGQSGGSYVSDLISVTTERNFLKLSYWHNDKFPVPGGHFLYTNSFKFIAHLMPTSLANDVLGKSSYWWEQIIHQRRGYNFVEQMISGKRYLFETLCSEPVLDGLRLARMHSDIEIEVVGSSAVTDYSKKVHDMDMVVDWESAGFYAMTTLEFQTDTVVVNYGRGRTTAAT